MTPSSERRPLKAPGLRWGILLSCLVLILYGGLAWTRHSPDLIWDEGRYLEYAERLNDGWYVPDADPDFVNGPGYPILLMPFAHDADGWRWARLLNSVLMAGAVWFTWLTVRRYAGNGWALFSAAVTGLHPTLLWMGFALMTEPLAMFCLTGFVWSFCAALSAPRGWVWLGLVAALFLGWLTLTRVFFGHVLVATAGAAILAWPVIRAWRTALNRTLLILAGAFLLCVPYLMHTWQKTGQILCWSTNSGELLYWMTSTHPGENGHWFSTDDAQTLPAVAENHAAFYREVLAMPVLEREAAFKERAKEQLKANPKGVFYNWLCNLTRMTFGFPRSFLPEELRTVALIAINGPIVLLSVVAGILGFWSWRSMPAELWIVAAFAAFYLGGSTLAPGLPRYFVLVIPALLLLAAAVLKQQVKISLTPRQPND